MNTSHYQMAEADLTRLLQADLPQQKQAAALFIMRLREISRLSQSAIDDIISGSRLLFNSTLICLHAGIRQRLAEAEVDIADIFDEFQNPYTTLDTAYLQEKYINKEFNVLVRVQFFISNLKKLCITGATTNKNRGTLLH